MNKLLIISLIFLNGCASTTKDMQSVIIDEKTKKSYVFPSDKVLSQCAELPLLNGKTLKDIHDYAKLTLPEQYYACSADKDELAQWIKQFKSEVEKK